MPLHLRRGGATIEEVMTFLGDGYNYTRKSDWEYVLVNGTCPEKKTNGPTNAIFESIRKTP